ncbi:tyrosine phosphatase-like protein [Cercophora newfieldiana]|uniref:Very-long-chain (3R)-3-hydroxyacyl-CoA dehydratase n=1 Tax=Cercophora newfieldiana TaxID=92897 RepID=A0AA39Y537_9PEZI|nr:tyrosine phosphatase-like protein [Cercophora newfieldiana]
MAKSTSPKRGGDTGFGLRKAYLVFYNSASAIAWATVLTRVVSAYAGGGAPAVPVAVDEFARNTQSFAVMEILHALTGTVPAPFFTTLIQVFSRILLMWGISFPFPALNVNPFYSSMLVAWSITEIIRYSFFVFKQFDMVPGFLNWLRYSAFLILYPIGISSEVAMIVSALRGPALTLHEYYPYALISILLGYVPGSVILYSHMLRQRKKNLRAKPKTK